jgi:cytochrome c-type biogenesis protein CcmH/NrfG
VYYNIGNVFVQQGSYAEARAAYRAALRSRTVWLPAATSLARLLTTHFPSSPQAVREAVELAEQACRATENHNATALHTLAIAYHTAGQSSQAVQAAEQALFLARAAENLSLLQEVETFLMTARQRLSRHEVP